MATYYVDSPLRSGSVQGNAQNFRGPVIIENGFGITVPFTFTVAKNLTAGALLLATGDIIKLVQIPAGAIITELWLNFPDLDAGGPTLTLDLGLLTAGDNMFLDASTVGQAGGTKTSVDMTALSLPTAQIGIASTYPGVAEAGLGDILAITVEASATTGQATGVLNGWCRYTLLGESVY